MIRNKIPQSIQNAGSRVMVIIDYLTNITAVFGGILIVSLILIITVAVLLRYYFNFSVGWSTELAEYFIYASVVLAVPWVLKRDEHVIVDIVVSHLNPKNRRRVAIIINLIGVAIGIALFYYSFLATWENFVKGTKTIRIMPIPRYIPLLFMPVMSFLVSFQFFRKFWHALNYLSDSSEKQI